MTVGDIVTQLKYGELRSIAIKDDNEAIVSYINLSLIVLYGRFNLLTSEYIIDLQDNITEYVMPADYVNIEVATLEDGTNLPINDEVTFNGVNQVSYNTIQYPNPVTGTTLSVIYSASPASITYDSTDASTIAASLAQVVPLPSSLVEPLLHYVGYRAHGSMDGNIKAENNTHYMRYEASCKRIDNLGLVRRDVAPAYVNRAEAIESDYLPPELDYNNI
jgi:hypothetical protein